MSTDTISIIFAGAWFVMAQVAMRAEPKPKQEEEHVIHTGQAPNNVVSRPSQ